MDGEEGGGEKGEIHINTTKTPRKPHPDGEELPLRSLLSMGQVSG